MLVSLIVSVISLVILVIVSIIVYVKASNYKEKNEGELQKLSTTMSSYSDTNTRVDTAQTSQIVSLAQRTSNIETRYVKTDDLGKSIDPLRAQMNQALMENSNIKADLNPLRTQMKQVLDETAVVKTQFDPLRTQMDLLQMSLSNNDTYMKGQLSYFQGQLQSNEDYTKQSFVSLAKTTSEVAEIMAKEGSNLVFQAIGQYEADKSEVSSTLKNLNTSIRNLEDNYGQLYTDFGSFSNTTDTLSSQFQTMSTNLISLSNDVIAVKTISTKTSSDLAGLNKDYADLNAAFQTLTGKMNTIENTDIPGLKSSLGGFESQFQTLSSNISQFPSVLSDMTLMKGQFAGVQTSVSNIQGQLPPMLSNITSVQQVEVPQIRMDITTLQGGLSNLTGRVASLCNNTPTTAVWGGISMNPFASQTPVDTSLRGNSVLEFGAGVSKDIDAGKLGYQRFSADLDIVGAGTSNGSRGVRVHDNLYVMAGVSAPVMISNGVCIGAFSDCNCLTLDDIVKIKKLAS
jgi:archaellum component FlaC